MTHEISFCLDSHQQLMYHVQEWQLGQLIDVEFDLMREKSPIMVDLSHMISDILDTEFLYQFIRTDIWIWLRNHCAGKCQFRQIAYDGRGEDDYDPSCGDYWFVRCYLDFEKASDGVLFKLKWL